MVLKPYKNIPVGEFIQDGLNENNILRKDFSAMLGVNELIVDNIINAKQQLTPDLASKIATILGYDANFWLSIDNDYWERRKHYGTNKD